MAQSPLYAGGGQGDVVDVSDDAARQLGIASINGTVPVDSASALDASAATVTVTDDSQFDISTLPNVLLEDPNGDAVSPATESTISSELSREISTWSAGALAAAQSGDWTVGVEDSSGSDVNPAESEPQGNWPSGNDFAYATASTNVEALPANAVPDGVSVVVQAQRDNTDTIAVGNSANPVVTLAGGQTITYQPEDTSQIRVQAASSGDGVNVTHEVN